MFYKSVKILNFFLLPLLVYACSNKKDDLKVDFIKPPVIPINSIGKSNVAEKLNQGSNYKFEKLQDKSLLIKRTFVGKTDPFLFTTTGDLSQSINKLTLKGVYSINNKKYALINFGNLSGSIKEGYKGDSLNNLLPENLILSKVDLKEKLIILKNREKTFEIKMSRN